MKKKKLNVALFVVLLIVFFPAAFVYLIINKTQPDVPRKYTHNGYIAKLIASILWIVNSAIFMFFVPLYAVFGLISGIILLVLTILEKKMGKKFFNIIYLLLEAVLLVPFFMGFWAYFFGGYLGMFVFGIVGPIRGLRYTGPEGLEAYKAKLAAEAE